MKLLSFTADGAGTAERRLGLLTDAGIHDLMRSAYATSVSWLARHGPTPPIPEPNGEPPDAATVRRLAPVRRPGKISGAIENPVVDEAPRIADHPAAAGLGEG